MPASFKMPYTGVAFSDVFVPVTLISVFVFAETTISAAYVDMPAASQ